MKTRSRFQRIFRFICLALLLSGFVFGFGCGKRTAVSEKAGTAGLHEAPGLAQKSGIEESLNDVCFLGVTGLPDGNAALPGDRVGRIGFAVGSQTTILKTTDGGNTWRRALKRDPKGPDFVGVVFTATNEVWAVSKELLLHSSDCGATWQPAAKLPGMFYYYGPYTASTNAYYQMQPPTCGAKVGRTADGGRSWTSLPANLPHNDYKAVCFTDDQHGWVVGDRGRLALTMDGGQNWQEQKIADAPYLEQVWFVNSQTGWIRPGYEHGGGILATRDGGQTWRRLPAGLDPLWNILDLQFLDENTGFLLIRVAHDQCQVLRSLDGGVTWKLLGKHRTPLTALCFVESDRGWVVGAKGCIFHYAP